MGGNVNPWMLVGALSLAVAGFFYGINVGENRTQVKWDADKLQSHQQYEKDLNAARDKEFSLQGIIVTNEKVKNEALKNLASDYLAVIASLHNRPDRPKVSQASANPGDSVGCTGAGLYGPDAKFLVGEAARGNRLREELAFCQTNYDQIRLKVNEE
jgi:hypothetical protein